MTAAPGRRAESEFVRVRESRDPGELQTAMGGDRAYCAYALAQLDPARFGRARFWLAQRADGASGIVVQARGNGRTMLLIGNPTAVGAALGGVHFVVDPAADVAMAQQHVVAPVPL